MNLAKLFKFGKKGSKKSGGGGSKSGNGDFEWPSGFRIGVFGHNNAGKTVYFTVLNEDCKVSQDLQISINDNATAGELLSNYKKIWGVGSATGVGTVVDLKEDRKFPDPSIADRLLKFTAILDGSIKVPVITLDYPGDAVAIGEPNDFTDKVADFMNGCDGLLFLFDPKVLNADLQCQAHVAAFVNMLEKLAPLDKKLPIPVALVISKSDTLKGFNGEEQSVLISAEDEHIVCEDFELFLNKVLSSSKISNQKDWAGTVRNVLVKLKDLVKVAVGRTLDFQIFFVSQTGESPSKVGAEVGRSIYTPPTKVRPVGVRKPMYWLLKAISRNKSLIKFRKFTKFVAMICLAWIVLVSGVYLWHFQFQLGRATAYEDNILKHRNDNPLNTNSEEQVNIQQEYTQYLRSTLLKKLFDDFEPPVEAIRQKYSEMQSGGREQKLNNIILGYADVINDQQTWPDVDPIEDTVIKMDFHLRIISDLETYTKDGDSTSILFMRANSALKLWNQFEKCIVDNDNDSAWALLHAQINYEQKSLGTNITPSDNKLHEAYLVGKTETKKAVVAKRAGVDLSGRIKEINGNNDPEYRLKTAVDELKQLKNDLGSSGDPADIKMINKYLSDARRWTKKQKYTYRVNAMPPDGHLHIESVPEDDDPSWGITGSQILSGDDNEITWKPGYVIHIAYEDITKDCSWGKKPIDQKILLEDYSLFDMEGEITLNAGTKVTISFKPSLKQKLPKLKK